MRPRSRRIDLLGLLLLGGMAAWTVVVSVGRPAARPGPVLALLGAVLVSVAAGRRWGAGPLPAVVAIAVMGAVVLGFPGVLEAGGGPTGYANANATLASMGAIGAAATAAAAARRDRPGWAVLTLVLTAGVALTQSVAGVLALATVALLAIGATAQRSATLAVAGGVVAVSLTLGVTVAIADGGDPFSLGERAALRADLWASALDAVRDEPVRGLGSGAYEERAAISPDADLRWAHHGYLQQGAEQGVPGLLLLLALLGWAYARLWLVSASSSVRSTAGASVVTVVALHASVDHVLHHPAVPLVAALLYGWATHAPDRHGPAAG